MLKQVFYSSYDPGLLGMASDRAVGTVAGNCRDGQVMSSLERYT